MVTATAPTTIPPVGTPEYTNYLVSKGATLGVDLSKYTVPTSTPPPPVSPKPVSTTTSTLTAPSPEDQKLLAMGITPEQLKQMNTPEGLDPTSFQNLIGNVEMKLKTNNELVTQRGYLIKQLYDNPLTPEQLKALPEDIQRVVGSGDKDTIELQMRLLNDQIAGRANTLSQSIKYLADSYQTHVKDVEDQKNNAIKNVISFVDAYGSKAPQVLSSLYGPAYLDKLKAMGIDINAMAAVQTLAQERASQTGGTTTGDTTTGTDAFTKSQLNNGAQNAGLSLEAFKALPYNVKNFYTNASTANLKLVQDVLAGVKSGTNDPVEEKKNIDGLNLPDDVKTYLKGLIDKASPAPKGDTRGLFSLSGAWEGLKYLLGK